MTFATTPRAPDDATRARNCYKYVTLVAFLTSAAAAMAWAQAGDKVTPAAANASAVKQPAPAQAADKSAHAAVADKASAKAFAPPAGIIKGGNVSAWNITDSAKVFADAKRLGLDTITVPVRINMTAASASQVTVDAASLAFAKSLVQANASYNYIIEPYPWIDGGNVPETDLDPADKAAWFVSYQAALVALAQQFPKAWGLYVASNLVKIEDQAASWISLVKGVRAAFPGKIIYRTQWWATAAWEPSTIKAYQAKLANPLFGAVDVIAIAAYFELSEVAAPTAADIKAALRSTSVFARKQDVYAEVMALGAKWHKPIFLGELSCPAVDFGAQNPWDPAASETPNATIQRNYLTAYLETFARDPEKFMGFSLFTIGHPTVTPYELAPSAAEYVRGFKLAR